VYTGKLLFAIYDLISKDYFVKGSRILMVHTGGTTGILGMASRFKL
jgi:1-aminocyclopropane-1-carboxylate deaminase